MRRQFKTLETLVQEAVKRLAKLRDENKRLTSELKFARSENARLQVQLRDYHTLTARHDRIRQRLEKLYRTLEKLEVVAATKPAPIPIVEVRRELDAVGEAGGDQ